MLGTHVADERPCHRLRRFDEYRHADYPSTSPSDLALQGGRSSEGGFAMMNRTSNNGPAKEPLLTFQKPMLRQYPDQLSHHTQEHSSDFQHTKSATPPLIPSTAVHPLNTHSYARTPNDKSSSSGLSCPSNSFSTWQRTRLGQADQEDMLHRRWLRGRAHISNHGPQESRGGSDGRRL